MNTNELHVNSCEHGNEHSGPIKGR